MARNYILKCSQHDLNIIKARDTDICLRCPISIELCQGGCEAFEFEKLETAPRDCPRDFALWHHWFNGVRISQANEIMRRVYDWPRPPRTTRPFFRAVEQVAERQEMIGERQAADDL